MNTENTAPAKPFRYLSVCSGMEAASVAWHPLGWEAAGFSEIEPFPCAILKHRFPNTPNYGSLTEYQSWPLEPGSIDLLVGGTPCQSFSVAGLRKGMSDPRGNLALTFLGLADRLRPRWIIWENVPGVLSSNGGRDFGAFLGALGQLGYGWAYRVLDAQHFGVPQRRRRVFVVATSSGDGRLAGEVLSLPEGLRGYLASRQQKRKGPAADAGAGVEADGLQRTVGTLCADTHPGAYSGQDAYTGRLIPDQKPVIIDRAAFKQGENALYDPVIEETDTCPTIIQRGPHAVQPPIAMRESGQGFWMQDDKAGPIRAEGENRPSRPSHVIGEPTPYRKAKRAQSTTDDESWVEGEVSNTLNNFDLGDTRTTHAVVEPIPLDGMNLLSRLGEAGEAHSMQDFKAGDPMYTLTKGHHHGVAQPIAFQPGNLARQAGAAPSTETFPTLTKDSGDQSPHVAHPTVTTCTGQRQGCSSEAMASLAALEKAGAFVPMAVRRLTPVECERLQGFPDNWSRIPWKGKPEEDCPDGPRYKACGNSMAVPVMRWIGERIKAYEAS